MAVTLSTDLILYSNQSISSSSQRSIQHSASYGVGYGREIEFPPKAISISDNTESAGPLEDVNVNNGIEILKRNLVKENSEEGARMRNNNKEISAQVKKSEHAIRRPRLAYARRTSYKNAAPVFRSANSLLNSFDADHVEKFVLKDVEPMLHQEPACTSLLCMMGMQLSTLVLFCFALFIFIRSYREGESWWLRGQNYQMRWQSQRSL